MAGDTIYLNNQKISFHDNNTYAFTVSFAKDKLNIDIGDNTHGGLKYSTNDYTLNGRIWEKYKIISFWQYNFSDFNIINIDFDPHNYDKINPFTFSLINSKLLQASEAIMTDFNMADSNNVVITPSRS